MYSEFGNVTEAERALDLGAAQPGGEMADAVRAWVHLFDGRCASALNLTNKVLSSGSARERAAILAAGAGTRPRASSAAAMRVADTGYRAAVAADAPLMVAGWAGIRGLAEPRRVGRSAGRRGVQRRRPGVPAGGQTTRRLPVP
jgi:hypothetical protein